MNDIILPYWFDAHTHLRQGALMAPIIQSQLDMACYAVLAMPNTKPIIGVVSDDDNVDKTMWSIESYRQMISQAGGDALDHVITPLYLHQAVTPDMIKAGVQNKMLQAAKCYPPHGTTNASSGYPLASLMDNGVIQAMQDHGVILCIHGEEHGLKSKDYFDRNQNAEDIFYREYMPRLVDQFPELKIVCEHVTTKTAIDFVQGAGKNVAATITPQHLIYNIGDLIMGLKYHLFCLPVLKFEEDRQSLINAVTTANQTQFFAGTDSAAHTLKATACGCAAGCFTGGIAPQLYAQAFDEAGIDLFNNDGFGKFKAFLCDNGPDFYELPKSTKTFALMKTPQRVDMIHTDEGDITPLSRGIGQDTIPWSIKRLQA